MTTKNETFASVMRSFEPAYELRTVFTDFLTLTICAFSPGTTPGISSDEELYLHTIEPYKHDEVRHRFPLLLSLLVKEMEERKGSSDGNDVLGEFYEEHLYRKGASQFFTPWSVCELTSQLMAGASDWNNVTGKRIRILDPCVGSGRLLVTTSRIRGGIRHHYFGIDIDSVCVKMTTLNLLLNGIFHFEVMQADALKADDFMVSYRTGFTPFGIRRITEKEKSPLWYINKTRIREQSKENTDVTAVQMTMF